MVGDYPAAEIGVERVSADGGRVTVDNFPRGVRGFKLFQNVGVGVDYARIIHKFAQTEKFVLYDIFFDVLSAEYSPACFKRSCGNAGRKL